MAHTAHLQIKDNTYSLISCDYEFVKFIGYHGQLSSNPTGGLIRFTLASPDNYDMFFHDWMQNTMECHDGSIFFTVVDAGNTSPRTLYFRKAYCIHLNEYFNRWNEYGQMITEITISAAEIAFGDDKVVFENYQPNLNVHDYSGSVEHTVKRGDTLWSLAREYRVSVEDLVKWNKIDDPDRIKTGERLVVGEMSAMGKSSCSGKKITESISYVMGIIGTGFSANAGMRYSEFPGGKGFWVGKNGKMYDLSLAGKNGGYMRSASMAKSASAFARGTGNTLGFLTTVYAGYQFVLNPTFENGFSFAGGAGGLLYWPLGVVDSYIHFGTDVVVPDVRRHQLEMLERIDNGTFNTWDYRNRYPNLTGPCP